MLKEQKCAAPDKCGDNNWQREISHFQKGEDDCWYNIYSNLEEFIIFCILKLLKENLMLSATCLFVSKLAH